MLVNSRLEVERRRGEGGMSVQLLGGIGLADDIRDAREHVVQSWAVGCCGSLGVRFL